LKSDYKSSSKLKKIPLTPIFGLKKAYMFRAGDILKVVYIAKNNAYTFNGVCMAVRGKFKNPNLSFLLRNVIMGVGIEMGFLYFGNRLFSLHLEFYKKKHLFARTARLFYIRNRINSQSRVK
jgi:ribosomal protein L19